MNRFWVFPSTLLIVLMSGFLQVFLQHAPLNRGVTQTNVITKSRLYLYIGLLWCAFAVSLQGLSAAALGITPSIWFLDNDVEQTWFTPFLFATQLLGFVVCYLVQVAVFFNYAAQCEVLVASVNGIFIRLREKSTDLKVAMHVGFSFFFVVCGSQWFILSFFLFFRIFLEFEKTSAF